MKHKHPTPEAGLSRRQFLRNTAVCSAGFMVLPGAVIGLRGAGPNQKLNLAGIGFGGQGAHDLAAREYENIISLCDVDKNYAAPIFKKYPKAKQFTDYRKMHD